MSIRAICLGVVEQLKLMLDDPRGMRCGYEGDGDFVPPANSPFYVSVSYAGVSSKGLRDNGSWLAYSVDLTFHADLSGIAPDRRGLMLLTPKAKSKDDPRTGLAELTDVVAAWFVQRYDVLDAANQILSAEGPEQNGFIEPFSNLQGSKPVTVDGKVRMEITLSGASRITTRQSRT